MEVTIDFIKSSFDKFNIEYFKGALLTPLFEISHCRNALGDFRRRGNLYRIRISDYYIRQQRDIEQTLLHEMIHLFQSQFKYRDRSHGETFKDKAFEINNKGGWYISRTSNVKGCQVNPKYAKKETSKPKAYYMMVYKSVTGKYFLFRMALRSMSKWVDTVANYRPSVIQFATFTSNDEEFESYPSCRTTARGSYITKEQYDSIVEKYNLKIQEKLSVKRMAV